jgi:hypothetical protein
MSVGFAPFFARFRRSGDRWFAFAGRPAEALSDSAQLVAEAPEFIGAALSDRPLPRAAMVAPGSESSRVLVVVGEAGDVAIVACPEPGKMTPLVGEMLAASAKLWHQQYDGLARPFADFLGMSLLEWISIRVGPGWPQDKFRAGLDESLGRGKFPLVIVAAAVDSSVEDALVYLKNLNLEARVLGYDYLGCAGDEAVRPRLLRVEAPKPSQPEQSPQPRPSAVPQSRPVAAQPQPAQPMAGQVATPTVGVGATRPTRLFDGPQKEYEPFVASNATPKQQEILERLLPLDELGLVRKGFDYFRPKAEGKAAMEGTIAIVIDQDRWPFPSPDEVIVIVNTGQEFLPAYLHSAPAEIEDFLGSLPRVEKKERKGNLLLRATNTHEATQLVNELRALKEIAGIG